MSGKDFILNGKTLDELLLNNTNEDTYPVAVEAIEPTMTFTRYVAPTVDHQYYRDQLWVTDKNGDEKYNYDEGVIAEWFAVTNNLRYYKGVFYSITGAIDYDDVDKDLYESMKPVIKSGLANKVKAVMSCVAKESYQGKIEAKATLIPLANGEIEIEKDSWRFITAPKYHVPYRLPCSFVPFDYRQRTPMLDKWLNDLFHPTDQLTLQEYMGYCLLPTTAGQKALFVIGDAGTGKSVLGTILRLLLGNALLSTTGMKEFMDNKYQLAELENKLVLYDDDIDDAALEKSGIFKKLVTNHDEILVERKYERPFKITPYARLVCCGNTMLTSLYDRTEGFDRRLLPISVKPKSPDRKAIPQFEKLLEVEAVGILQWALIGLYRLIDNDWQFTESERTKDFLGQVKSDSNHYPEFLDTAFEFLEGADVTSEEITDAYKVWCDANSIEGTRPRTLQKWLKDNAEKYSITYTTNVARGDKRVRGYFGVKVRDEWTRRGSVVHLK